MRHPKRAAPGRRRALPALALLAAAGLLALAGATTARYVARQSESGLISAEEFYFTSDLLREGAEPPSYFIDPQRETFQINLSNAEDAQRVTPEEIEYSVKVKGGTAAQSGGTLGSGTGAAVITVTPTAEKVTVTVTSSKPYVKILSATFVRGAGNRYEVEDAEGNAAAVLTVICTDAAKAIPLKLPGGVYPDPTDGRVTANDGGGYAFASPGPGVYALVLLKTDISLNLSQGGSRSFADAIDLTAASS